jgi:hypothetical protein
MLIEFLTLALILTFSLFLLINKNNNLYLEIIIFIFIPVVSAAIAELVIFVRILVCLFTHNKHSQNNTSILTMFKLMFFNIKLYITSIINWVFIQLTQEPTKKQLCVFIGFFFFMMFLLLGAIGLKLSYVSDNTVIVAQSLNDINSSVFNLENRIEFIEYYKEKLSPETTQTFVDRIKRISISTLTKEIIRLIFDYFEHHAYHDDHQDTDAGKSDKHAGGPDMHDDHQDTDAGKSDKHAGGPDVETQQAENPGKQGRGRLRRLKRQGRGGLKDDGPRRQEILRQLAQQMYGLSPDKQAQLIQEKLPPRYHRAMADEIERYNRVVNAREIYLLNLSPEQRAQVLQDLPPEFRQQVMREMAKSQELFAEHMKKQQQRK